MSFTVEEVEWATHEHPLMALRRAIFIDEQGVSEALELDGLDPLDTTQHFLAFLDQEPIAAGRLLADGQIGRICVSPQHRRKHYGTRLLKVILQVALSAPDLPHPWLHAQTSALTLYQNCHFEAQGEEFMEADIPHQKMELRTLNKALLQEIFDHKVVRPNSPLNFSPHISRMLAEGRREVLIFSLRLDQSIYNTEISELLSRFARKHRQTNIRILVQDTNALKSGNHPIVQLARRLPSSIAIQQLVDSPKTFDEGYIIIDREFLIFFNKEINHEGFVTYRGKAESKSIVEDFENLWRYHSGRDPNLAQLSI